MHQERNVAAETASLAAENQRLVAENERLRQQVENLIQLLRDCAPNAPLDGDRQSICKAVDEWVTRSRGGQASVFEIAQAVLQAAASAGWMVPPVDGLISFRFTREIGRLIREAESKELRTLAYLLDMARIEARRHDDAGDARDGR